MKTIALLALGVCGGAFGAWLVQTGELNEGFAVDSRRAQSGSMPGSSDQSATAEQTPLSDDVAQASRERAFTDPAGLFAQAESSDSIEGLIDALEVLLATDPVRVFEILERHRDFGSQAFDELYWQTVRAMTDRDPTGTIARLQPLMTGRQRNELLANIAQAYAANDMDAALIWVRSLQPPSAEALGKLIETVGVEDMLRAYDLTRQINDEFVTVETVAWALSAAAFDGRQPIASLATSLAQRGTSDSDFLLSRLMSRWAQRDSVAAIAWIEANRAHVSEAVANVIVTNLAFADVRLAAAMADSIPREFQGDWLATVAMRYAQFDSAEGLEWLSKYQARGDYHELLTQVLGSAARTSPQMVASFIETSGVALGRTAVLAAGFALAEQNPETAVQWAMRLGDPEQAAWAIEGVVQRWTQLDPGSAQRWVYRQPQSAARDRMLDALMQYGYLYPDIDPESVFHAYDSQASAEQMIAEYIGQTVYVQSAGRDAAFRRAEQLLEWITDPELHEQVEQAIARAR